MEKEQTPEIKDNRKRLCIGKIIAGKAIEVTMADGRDATTYMDYLLDNEQDPRM